MKKVSLSCFAVVKGLETLVGLKRIRAHQGLERMSCAGSLATLLLLSAPLAAEAQFTSTLNGLAITITGYSGPGGDLTIPSTLNGLPVTSIGGGAFQNNASITSVTIPDSVTSIGSNAFGSCSSLTNVVMPNSVTNIAAGLFQYCSQLSSITLPDSATNIGDSAFLFCANLANITIPSRVTSIERIAFMGCASLTNIAFPNSLTNIGGAAFSKCFRLANISLPTSVISIGGAAFEYCGSLTSVTIPAGVTYIGGGMFQNCTNLASVALPTGVVNIADGAFAYCTSLTSVAIPTGVTYLGGTALAYCTSLTNVTLPSTLTYMAGSPFSTCTGLTAITVDPLNPVYSSVDGVLFDKSQRTLLQYPTGRAGDYVIPSGVASIIGGAFNSSMGLTNITVPASVTNIGPWAVEFCRNLRGIYFEGNAPNPTSPFWTDSPFWADGNATIYYVPGTLGWGLTLGGYPTAFWMLPKPQILKNSPLFGMQANGFGFVISWATNLPTVVESCTDLANSAWVPLQTNTITGGWYYFSDPHWRDYPSRLYRVRAL